jgi:hypothetical protein
VLKCKPSKAYVPEISVEYLNVRSDTEDGSLFCEQAVGLALS